MKPSFYRDVTLFETQVRTLNGGVGIAYFAITNEGQLFVFDGKSASIHTLNAAFLSDLTSSNVALDYLEFFTGTTWGEAGPFRIARRTERLLFSPVPIAERRQEIDSQLLHSPIAFRSDGPWRAQATIQYGKTLSRVTFEVKLNGNVEMSEDQAFLTEASLKVPRMDGLLRHY